jgi:hypothetical protein
MTIPAATGAPNPHPPSHYVTEQQLSLLYALFFFVPKARIAFENGRVAQAFDLLRKAPVRVRSDLGVTKCALALIVMNQMPLRFRV